MPPLYTQTVCQCLTGRPSSGLRRGHAKNLFAVAGFRSLHSTLTALLEATNNWCVNIDKGLLNGVIFIDLKKTFDTIEHDFVIQKLVKYGLDQNFVSCFTSYLSSTRQQCSVNGQLSTASQITCGVPQGSLVGPLFFLLYINGLPNSLNNGTARMYADDTSISFAAPNPTLSLGLKLTKLA